LLDRAEDIFNKLLDSDRNEESKRHLLEIYQQEKNWQKAIAIAEELPDVASQRDIAEYYCEMAAAEIMRTRRQTAREYLDVALLKNRKCVRASLLLGDLHLQEGQVEDAIAAWQRIEQQDPAYLGLVAQRLADVYRRLDRLPEALVLFRGYLEHYPSLDMLDVVSQIILETEGAEGVYRLVRDETQRNPTLLGLERLMAARLALAPPEVRADIELAKTIVHGYTARLSRYRCGDCGFKARQHYWRCPACGGWETYSPKRSEEYELTP